jgi:predicted DNA-binding protein
MQAMIKTTIYLQEEKHEQLKNLADDRTNYSEHIRRAVDEYLEKMANGEQSKQS